MKNEKLSAEQEAVLAAYGRKGTILRACQGICDRVTHYRWMNTVPAYRERFQLAKEEFADKLLDYVTELSLEGEEVELWDKKGPVMQDGKVLVQRKKNHRFLGQLLKIHFPSQAEPNRTQIEQIVAKVLEASGILAMKEQFYKKVDLKAKLPEYLKIMTDRCAQIEREQAARAKAEEQNSNLNVTECNTETPVAPQIRKAEVPPPRIPISPEYIGSCNALGRPLRLNLEATEPA